MARSLPKGLDNNKAKIVLRALLSKRSVKDVARSSRELLDLAEVLLQLRRVGLIGSEAGGQLSLTAAGREVLLAMSDDPAFPWLDVNPQDRLAEEARVRFPKVGRSLARQLERNVSGRQGNLSGVASRDPAED